MFKNIEIKGWRQFERIDISFDSRLTILTGANGAGKTTILNLLNQHFGWNINFISTPERDKTGIMHYFASKLKDLFKENPSNNLITIGSIGYTDNDKKCNITVPSSVSSFYNIQLLNSINVNGLYIPSHRPLFSYSPITTIPTTILQRKDIFNDYTSLIKSKYFNSNTWGQKTPPSIIKETLIALATFGYGNTAIVPNRNALKMYEDFQEILRIILPPKIGFEKILIEVPEVIFSTKTGNFSIDAVSGGVAAIIDLAWQIFMFDEPTSNFVVTIDEPENHLHPEMQRTLLVNLLKAFPNVQFIIATHNPFMVSSVPDSNVYVLNYNENNRVISTKLDTINKAGSSNDILRDVLGLPTTMPLWVEKKLNEIVQKFTKMDMNQETLSLLRKEMESIGFDKIIPDTIVKVVEGGKKND